MSCANMSGEPGREHYAHKRYLPNTCNFFAISIFYLNLVSPLPPFRNVLQIDVLEGKDKAQLTT